MNIVGSATRRSTGRAGRILPAVLTILVGLCAQPVTAVAEEADRTLVLGRWEGRATFGESAPAALEFSEADGVLKWAYTYQYDAVLWGDAAGTVSTLSPPVLELAGAWTKHAVSGAVGTKLKFVLKIEGDRLDGTVTAEMNNTPVMLSLTRKK